MPNNDDLINDILKELDNNNAAEQPSVSDADDDAQTVSPVNGGSGSEPTVYAPEDPGDSPTEYYPDDQGSEPTVYNETEPQPDQYYGEPQNNDPQYNNEQYNDYYPQEQQYAYAGGYDQQYPPQYGEPLPDAYYDQYPQRGMMPHKKKKKKKRSRVPGVLILTTLIFAVSIILSMIIIIFGKDMLGIGKSESPKMIIIKEGATTADIAQQLKDEEIIKFPKLFIYFTKLRKADSMYIPGEHFIRPNMAYETIIQNLTTDEVQNKETVTITFKEGINIYEAADLLEKNGVCKADDFIFNFNSGGFGFKFEEKLPLDYSLKLNRMEGYVFPDTYYFYKDMDAVQVCQKIYYNFDSKMTADRYKKIEASGLSLDEIITLASIVQKEAASSETMKTVALVFWNRLHDKDKFPKLESDPTSNYSKYVVKPHLEVYNKTMIEAYDTYLSAGLPPGAICNPGIEAIDAVLEPDNNPEHKDYLYFIANIYTGETVFSKTYEEHLENDERIKNEIKEAEAASRAAEENQGDEYYE